jgi:hypothetical protein
MGLSGRSLVVGLGGATGLVTAVQGRRGFGLALRCYPLDLSSAPGGCGSGVLVMVHHLDDVNREEHHPSAQNHGRDYQWP